MPSPDAPAAPADFTLVTGGPLYQAFVRTHLSGTQMELLHRRVLFLVAVTWLPAALLALVGGTLLAGLLANRILHMGGNLQDFTVEIAAVTLLVWAIVFGPLSAFSVQLVRARRRGLQEYGRLAEPYVRGFDTKWLRQAGPPGERLLGSSDVQSLADLGTSYALVARMQALPLSRDAVLRVSAATLLPLSPLLLTSMPLEEVLRRLVGMFF